MNVTVLEDLQTFVIKAHGRFEEQDYKVLQEVLEKSIRSLCRQVLIDLNDLQNITTAGQRVLLAYSSQLQAVHRPLVFYNINPAVMAAFEDSAMVKVINIAHSLKEAQALFLNLK